MATTDTATNPDTFPAVPKGTLLPGRLACTGLQRAFRQVLPHRSGDESMPPLNGLLLDFRDQQLNVVATDRYTLAIARVVTDAAPGTRPWRLWLSAQASDDLARMLERTDQDELVELDEDWEEDEEESGPVLTAHTRHQSERLGADPTAVFPDWRATAAEAVGDGTGLTAPLPMMKAEMLARWGHLTGAVTFRARQREAGASNPRGAVVVNSSDFLGIQMPYRYTPIPEGFVAPCDWTRTLTPQPAGETTR